VTNITRFAKRHESRVGVGSDLERIWKIYLAGTMQMLGPGGEDALPKPRKSRGLLAYICLTPDKRASRSRLATLLWDKTDDLARRNLRQALYDLERVNGVRAGGLIQSDQQYVSLNHQVC